jgi:methylglutamate dehydrogenase subunit D
MARNELNPLTIDSPFGRFLLPNRLGKKEDAPGLSIEWIWNQTQVEVVSFEANDSVLETAIAMARRHDGDLAFRHGPNRCFVVARDANLLPALKAAMPVERAAVIDQSHGRICLAIEGPRVEDVLSKLFAVDFDGEVFKNGTGIATAHHVVFTMIYRESKTRFLLFPHRSFSRDFLKSLIKAGTEYGVEIEG